MADTLRVVESSALDRLASAIAVQNGLSPEEGREEARRAVGFFSALLNLPVPNHGQASQTPSEDERRAEAA